MNYEKLRERMANANTLLFSNKIFHSGLNITVRRGTKWHGTKSAWIDLGEGIKIFCDHIHTQVKCFNDLNDLDLEHDPECRTWYGLLKVMLEVYPDFSTDEEVTLVYFFMPDARKPVIGDDILFVEMMCERLGGITNVIDLDHGFYEVHIEHYDGCFGNMLINQFEWSHDHDGWFQNKSYVNGRNNG